MIPLHEMLPQVALIGQLIGQFYCAVFTEIALPLGKDRAEVQAFMLTKTFIEAVLAAQRDKTLVTSSLSDSVLTQVLAGLQPKGNS